MSSIGPTFIDILIFIMNTATSQVVEGVSGDIGQAKVLDALAGENIESKTIRFIY